MGDKRKLKKRKALLAISKLCHYCKCKLSKHTATLDHVIPKSKGGSNKLSNLVLACHECNRKKANKDFVDFLLELD